MIAPRRWYTALLCALTLLAALASVATPASADVNSDISLTTSSFPSMRPGETAWVATFWHGATVDAHNFRMTASAAGATISYPTNTGSYSSLYGSSDLLSMATDFAALKITVDDSTTSNVTVDLHVTYDLESGDGRHGPGDRNNQNRGGRGDTTARWQNLHVTLPVTPYNGPAVTAISTSLGPVSHGATTWVNFSVRGEKPGITSLRATLSAPAGITVAYPAGVTSAGLSQGSTLGVGTTDYFAFQLTVGAIAPGSYSVTLTMSWGGGQHQSATVPVVVT